MTTLGTTQRRLDGMDRDEAGLKSMVEGLATGLSFAMPEDTVAAGRMLEAKLTDALEVERRRLDLEPELQAAQINVNRSEVALGSAKDILTGLCRMAGLDTLDEATLVLKRRAHGARLSDRRKEQTLLDSLATAGDGTAEGRQAF